MNRKTLVIAISIIIAACAGLYFWAEQQKQAFDASLPKPPAVEQQQTQVETDTTGGHWHGDEWHAEPHPAPPAPVEEPSPTEGLVKAELRQHPAEPRKPTGRPPMWMDDDGELPPEGTPRPFKHLSGTEIEAYDTSHLSDEDWLLLQNEFFFRMPKAWRDEYRQQRVELKKQEEFFKWYEEQFPGKGAGVR